MGRKYKRYTEEFKRDALAMSASSDVSDAQLERDLGIDIPLIIGETNGLISGRYCPHMSFFQIACGSYFVPAQIGHILFLDYANRYGRVTACLYIASVSIG